jgi:hypothetical protein
MKKSNQVININLKCILLVSLGFVACKQTTKEYRTKEEDLAANGTYNGDVIIKEYFLDDGRKRVWHYYSNEKNKSGTYFNIDTSFVEYDILHRADKNKYPLAPIVLQCCKEWNLQKIDIFAEGLEKNIVFARVENSDKLRIKYLGKNIRLKPTQYQKISVGLWENTYKNDSIQLHLTLQINEPIRMKGENYSARLGEGKIQGVVVGKIVNENIHAIIKVPNK